MKDPHNSPLDATQQALEQALKQGELDAGQGGQQEPIIDYRQDLVDLLNQAMDSANKID